MRPKQELMIENTEEVYDAFNLLPALEQVRIATRSFDSRMRFASTNYATLTRILLPHPLVVSPHYIHRSSYQMLISL